MSVIDELICIEEDGTISFGNYLLDTKTKKDNVEYNGDIYKVKTFNEITRLEKNGMFVYESVPGTTVHNLSISDGRVDMKVEGMKDSRITLELEPAAEYKVYVDGVTVGNIRTNISGKLSFSIEAGSTAVGVKIVRI